MFSQVILAEKDRKYHRLLWRDLDPTKPVEVYGAVRLTSRDRASPYLAQDVHSQPCPRLKRELPSSSYGPAPRYVHG